MEFVETDNGVNNNMMIELSMGMFNRKYKIRSDDIISHAHEKQVHPKDVRFYNKRLLHLFKNLLLKNQTSKTSHETNEYVSNLPTEIVEMGGEFITQCILFFKREDTNELIQQELIDAIQEIPCEMDNIPNMDDLNCLPNDTINEYDKQLYHSSVPKNMGVFEIEVENNEDGECSVIPMKREFQLRNNRLRVKGISKNNNMAILYEQDETKR